MTEICAMCGRAYEPTGKASRRRYYCSRKCGQEAYRLRMRGGEDVRLRVFKPETVDCAYCGLPFTIEKPSDARTRFCSDYCQKRYWGTLPHLRDKLDAEHAARQAQSLETLIAKTTRRDRDRIAAKEGADK